MCLSKNSLPIFFYQLFTKVCLESHLIRFRFYPKPNEYELSEEQSKSFHCHSASWMWRVSKVKWIFVSERQRCVALSIRPTHERLEARWQIEMTQLWRPARTITYMFPDAYFHRDDFIICSSYGSYGGQMSQGKE